MTPPVPVLIPDGDAYRRALDDESAGLGAIRFHEGIAWWHPGEQTRFQPEESDPWVP